MRLYKPRSRVISSKVLKNPVLRAKAQIVQVLTSINDVDVPISVKFSRTTYKQLIFLDWTNYNIQFIQLRLKKEYNPTVSIEVIDEGLRLLYL